MSSATVADAPASAAHLIQPGAPARPGETMIGCGAGVGFDGVTATPPKVSTTGDGLAVLIGCASVGRDTCDKLTMPDGSSIGRSSPGGGGSGTGPESSVGGLTCASSCGAVDFSAAANGDSDDGPLSGSDDDNGASGAGASGAGSSRRRSRGSGLRLQRRQQRRRGAERSRLHRR